MQKQVQQKSANQNPGDHLKTALCLVGAGDQHIWGMTTRERLIKQFAAEGVDQVVTPQEAAERQGPVVFIKADVVLDKPVVPVLARRLNLALMGDAAPNDADTPNDEASGQADAARRQSPLAIATNGQNAPTVLDVLAGGDIPESLPLLVRRPEDLDAAYWDKLRKNETPYVLEVTPQQRDQVEWRMFMGTYKGATDFVTKHVWPRPAFYVTRAIAPTAITPNMVTALSAVAVVLAFYWFWQGHYWPGIIAAWVMTFLDTVDGKLARTTLSASKWGDIFDHGIDLIHPPFWYYAWAVGLSAAGFHWSAGFMWAILAAIMGGYIVQRVMEGIAIKWLGIEIHIWRPIDTFFRQITARRNPNLVLLSLSVLFGRPDWGLIAVAIWTLVCLFLHAVQLVQGFLAKRKDEALVSWMRHTPGAGTGTAGVAAGPTGTGK